MITILIGHVANIIWVATLKVKGQCHSMSLQQQRVRPMTLLFEVGF